MYAAEKRIYRSAFDLKHKLTVTIRVDRADGDASAESLKRELDNIFDMVRAGFNAEIMFDPDLIGGANDGS